MSQMAMMKALKCHIKRAHEVFEVDAHTIPIDWRTMNMHKVSIVDTGAYTWMTRIRGGS
jgi:hypothetical protein